MPIRAAYVAVAVMKRDPQEAPHPEPRRPTTRSEHVGVPGNLHGFGHGMALEVAMGRGLRPNPSLQYVAEPTWLFSVDAAHASVFMDTNGRGVVGGSLVPGWFGVRTEGRSSRPDPGVGRRSERFPGGDEEGGRVRRCRRDPPVVDGKDPGGRRG